MCCLRSGMRCLHEKQKTYSSNNGRNTKLSLVDLLNARYQRTTEENLLQRSKVQTIGPLDRDKTPRFSAMWASGAVPEDERPSQPK